MNKDDNETGYCNVTMLCANKNTSIVLQIWSVSHTFVVIAFVRCISVTPALMIMNAIMDATSTKHAKTTQHQSALPIPQIIIACITMNAKAEFA